MLTSYDQSSLLLFNHTSHDRLAVEQLFRATMIESRNKVYAKNDFVRVEETEGNRIHCMVWVQLVARSW